MAGRAHAVLPGVQACRYPRTDPVVIMIVEDGDRLLLGRQGLLTDGVYSALAGFVERGESLQAVAREVSEERASPSTTSATSPRPDHADARPPGASCGPAGAAGARLASPARLSGSSPSDVPPGGRGQAVPPFSAACVCDPSPASIEAWLDGGQRSPRPALGGDRRASVGDPSPLMAGSTGLPHPAVTTRGRAHLEWSGDRSFRLRGAALGASAWPVW